MFQGREHVFLWSKRLSSTLRKNVDVNCSAWLFRVEKGGGVGKDGCWYITPFLLFGVTSATPCWRRHPNIQSWSKYVVHFSSSLLVWWWKWEGGERWHCQRGQVYHEFWPGEASPNMSLCVVGFSHFAQLDTFCHSFPLADSFSGHQQEWWQDSSRLQNPGGLCPASCLGSQGWSDIDP